MVASMIREVATAFRALQPLSRRNSDHSAWAYPFR